MFRVWLTFTYTLILVGRIIIINASTTISTNKLDNPIERNPFFTCPLFNRHAQPAGSQHQHDEKDQVQQDETKVKGKKKNPEQLSIVTNEIGGCFPIRDLLSCFYVPLVPQQPCWPGPQRRTIPSSELLGLTPFLFYSFRSSRPLSLCV